MKDRPRRPDESPIAYGLKTRRFGSARGTFWLEQYQQDPAGTTDAIEAMIPAPPGTELRSALDPELEEQLLTHHHVTVSPEFAELYPPAPGEVRAARGTDVSALSDDDLHNILFGHG